MKNRESRAETEHQQRIQEIRELEKRVVEVRRRSAEIVYKVTEDHRFLQLSSQEEKKRSEELFSELVSLGKEEKEVNKEIERKIEIYIDLTPESIISGDSWKK